MADLEGVPEFGVKCIFLGRVVNITKTTKMFYF